MHDIKINGAKNKLFDTKRVSQKLILGESLFLKKVHE